MTLQFFNKIFNLGGTSTAPLDFGGFKLGVSTAVKKVLEFFGYPLNLTNIPTATTLAGYKVYGNTEQGLPDGYTQLEYIVTDGNAYVDTGYKPSPSLTRFEGSFLITTQKIFGLFGGRQNTYPDTWSINVFTIENGLRLDWVYGRSVTEVPAIIGNKHTISITRNKATIDGNQHTATAEIINKYIDFNFYIGTLNNAGTPYAGFGGNIYDCKLYDNDNLIRDYIPCKRNSDNAVGLYDMVENKFYASASTTAFTAGTEVSITPSTPVPIQSVGEKTKNLLDISAFNSNKAQSITGSIKLKANTNYTISLINEDGSTTGIRLGSTYVCNLRQGTTIISKFASNTSTIQLTEEQANQIDNYIIYYAPAQYSGTSPTLRIQLEESSTATTYEPYGYKVPVKVGSKNLLDISSLVQETTYTNGSTLSIKADGTIKLHKVVGDSINIKLKTPITEVGKTYTLKVFGSPNIKIGYPQFDNNYISTTNGYKTFVGSSVHNILLYSASNFEGDVEYKLMLVEGTDVPEIYEPYFEPTTANIYLSEPLRKLGDYADYIDFENQEVVRNIKSRQFTNSDKWVIADDKAQYLTTELNIENNYFTIAVMCDVLTYANNVRVGTNNIATQKTTSLSRIWISPDVDTTKLTSHYLLYPLATPTTEKITLPDIAISKGDSVITTDTEIKPSDMYGKVIM